jgi:hypothetical protein
MNHPLDEKLNQQPPDTRRQYTGILPDFNGFLNLLRSHWRVARLSCRARVDRAADIVAVTLRNSRPSSSALSSCQRSFGVMVRTPNRQSIAGGSTAQNSLYRLEKFESPEGKVPPDSKRPPHQFAHYCLAKSARRTFQRDSNRSTGSGCHPTEATRRQKRAHDRPKNAARLAGSTDARRPLCIHLYSRLLPLTLAVHSDCHPALTGLLAAFVPLLILYLRLQIRHTIAKPADQRIRVLPPAWQLLSVFFQAHYMALKFQTSHTAA